MDDIYRRFFVLLSVAMIFQLLSSCGGGGGPGQNSENTNPPLSGNLNSGLTGRLYANNIEDGVMVDLATGKSIRTPDISWDATSTYSNMATFSAIPRRDGSEFLLTSESCQYHSEEPIPFRHRDCLAIIDSNGKTVSGTVLYDGLRHGAKISDDGRYVAFMYMDEPNISHPLAQLSIADRNFTQITSHTTIRHSADDTGLLWRDFDWLPNGQIVYGYDRSIYITSAYDTEGALLYTLPTDETGTDSFVYDPKVSPDGTKIAFRYMTNSNTQLREGTVWIMNIDATDPHRLVYTPGVVTSGEGTIAVYQVYNDFAWSSDGKYILVAVDGTTGDGGSPGLSDQIYAIPSDSRDVPLNDSGNHGIIKIRTYYESPGNLTSSFEPYAGTISWVQ